MSHIDWRFYMKPSRSIAIAGEDSKSAQEGYTEHRERMSQMFAMQQMYEAMYRQLADEVTEEVLKRISVTFDATAIKQLEQAINSLAK